MSFLNSVVAPLLLPSILWRVNDNAVHLTFDDGPHPVATPRVLDILGKHRIHATFFVVGHNVIQYPELVLRIVREGHTIGNHSQSHRRLMFRSPSTQHDEITRGNSTIENVLNQKPHLFRPPYGYFDFRTLAIARAEGLKVVMWDVDALDFAESSPGHIVRRVTRNVTHGSIVLHHDNDRTATIVQKYLDALIDDLLQRGFQFSAVPQ
jgi:peptidoglycan-N-acetylglucosamine deacetylase